MNRKLYRIVTVLFAVLFISAAVSCTNKADDLKEVIAYPNPYSPAEDKKITFAPTASTQFGTGKVEVIVYDYNMLEIDRAETVTDGSTPVTWYGVDSQGRRVSPGAYHINVIFTDTTTETVTNKMITVLVE